MSTNDTRKPREFWIRDDWLVLFYEPTDGSAAIHVIEYSAVASLQREIEEFKTGVQNFRCPSCNAVAGPFYPVNLMTELEALRKLLAAANKGAKTNSDALNLAIDENIKLREELERQLAFASLNSAYEQLQRQWKAAMDSANDRAAEAEALRKERDEALAQLAHRHIIGKAYEVSKESINRLAGELDALRAENQDYRAALSSLRNETKGLLGISEHAIRQDAGNTNYECAMNRVKEADAILAKYPKELK